MQPTDAWQGLNAQAMFQSILLIDDSDVDLFVNNRIIAMAKVAQHTVAMNSPLRALEYVKSVTGGKLLAPVPDLILLDINMPCMDGFEFLKELEAALPNTDQRPCVVMLTSSLDERDVVRAREFWSVLRFLNKPLTVDALEQLRIHSLRSPASMAIAA